MRRNLIALLFVPLFLLSCVTASKKKPIEEVLHPEKLWFAFHENGLEFKTDINNDGTPDKEFYYECLTWVPPIPDRKYSREEPFLVSRYVGEGISPFGKLILFRYDMGSLIIVGDTDGDKKLDGRFHYRLSPTKSKDFFVLEYEGSEDL